MTQSLSVQQLPATHKLPQQKSDGLAGQAVLLTVQAALTHFPLFAPVAVVQMSALPNTASDLH